MSGEVYIIVLVLALLLFAVFRRLVRNKFPAMRYHNLISGTLALVMATVVYISAVLVWFAAASWYPERDFDQTAWKNSPDKRYEMSAGIIDNQTLMGLSKQQVVVLLGEEDNKPDTNIWFYSLGIVPSLINIDVDILEIVFVDDRVTAVSQRRS